VAIIVIINTASTTKTHKSPVAIRPPNPNTNHINKRDTQNGRRSPTHAHNQYPYTQHSMQQNKEQKQRARRKQRKIKKDQKKNHTPDPFPRGKKQKEAPPTPEICAHRTQKKKPSSKTARASSNRSVQ
jgi:hypothetical protein